MKVIRLILLLLLCACSARGAEIITATVSITNTPSGPANTITVAGSTRTWTNSITTSPATLIQQTNTPSLSATQLVNHLALYPASYAHQLGVTNATNVTIRGLPGQAMAVTVAGGWAVVTFSTNTITSPVWAVRVPISIELPANQTNIASGMAEALNLSTQAISSASFALSNVVNLYSNQTVAGNKTFTGTNTFTNGVWTAARITNGNLNGTVHMLTNGLWTNGILSSPKLTNGANYGNAFSSPGTNGASEQFGTGARAIGGSSLAVGNNALASDTDAVAVGTDSVASGLQSSAFGLEATASATNATAIGSTSAATAVNSTALGVSAFAGFRDSVAIGSSATSTTTNQIRLGTSTQTVSIPGVLAIDGTQTNTTWTGTNVLNGSLSFKSRANTALVNGANSAIVLGTNVYVRLSGATTFGGIGGFVAQEDGAFHIVEISGAVTNVIVNHLNSVDFATDATAANRIVTGTGANYYFTNNPTVIQVIYNATDSRWKVFPIAR